jgi:hypothetical protein
MADYKGPWNATHVLVGAVNVAPIMESLNVSLAAEFDERRFLGTVLPTQCDTGHRSAELTMAGVLNSPTSDAVGALDTTGVVVSALLSGNAVDMSYYGFQLAKISGLELALSAEKVDELTPKFTVAGEVNTGTVVAPFATRVAGANTDAAWSTRPDPTSAGGHAYLHVTSYTGTPTNLVVKLRTSATHGSFADLATFATVTGVGAWVLPVASGILEHLSISWAWTGGTAPTWDGFVGVAVD